MTAAWTSKLRPRKLDRCVSARLWPCGLARRKIGSPRPKPRLDSKGVTAAWTRKLRHSGLLIWRQTVDPRLVSFSAVMTVWPSRKIGSAQVAKPSLVYQDWFTKQVTAAWTSKLSKRGHLASWGVSAELWPCGLGERLGRAGRGAQTKIGIPREWQFPNRQTKTVIPHSKEIGRDTQTKIGIAMEREDQLFWSKEVYVRTFSNSSSPVKSKGGKSKSKGQGQVPQSVWLGVCLKRSKFSLAAIQYCWDDHLKHSWPKELQSIARMSGEVSSCTCNADHAEDKVPALNPPRPRSSQPAGVMERCDGHHKWGANRPNIQTISIGGFGAEWSRPTNFSGAHSTGSGQCFGLTSRNRWLGRFLFATISTKWTPGRKHSRSWGRTQLQEHGVLQQLLIRTPPSTEVQGTETISELQEVFHGPLPSRNGSNKGSCGTLRYHHNQWRNQASYFYILASLILRAWMQCSWVRMRTWRVTSLHWTWHTQRRPLFQAMCGRDCPGASWNREDPSCAHKVQMLDNVPPCGRPRQSPVWTQRTNERQLGWPLLTLVDIHYEWCSVLVLPSYNTFNLTLNHWCWGSELIARNLLGVTPNHGRVGHSNPPKY